ncbi:hypothetical protein GCM10011352_36530 [Marinobacterium zhoushanense]|uniref:Uncharacterized protein n=1 Tax=Marinobacterium zhoushanense TaxID=1679163 RepID=A0ABQ1KU80_9GAMM|nr:hypothetical protein [Marinobacterium zhoushanense]GGC06962.1 hypothetical protein GCM10011352_36530 [Marinobacterium zhoushanense]
MISKSQSISVRVSEDDYAYLTPITRFGVPIYTIFDPLTKSATRIQSQDGSSSATQFKPSPFLAVDQLLRRLVPALIPEASGDLLNTDMAIQVKNRLPNDLNRLNISNAKE